MMESEAGVDTRTSATSSEDQLIAQPIVLTQVPQTRSAVPTIVNNELDEKGKSDQTKKNNLIPS
ncbi:hypothetical protein TSMEX_006117 [Taenia solium]|eukprot:TsM_000140400 transcript=TsM_000140400 gene=TsM_000140400